MITAVRPRRISCMLARMLLLRLRVQRRGSLVEHQQARVVVQRPGDAQPLDLPARQPDAALAHHLLVAQRQLGDEGVRVRHLRHFLDAPAVWAVVAAGNVLADGAREQQVGLHHVTHLGAIETGIDHVEVVAIHRHRSFARLVEAHQQLGQRGLAGAAAAHDGHHLARPHVEADVLEHVGVSSPP